MLFSPFFHYKQYWNENTATHIAHCPLTILASVGESMEKLLEKIKTLSKVVSYKMNISKSIVFLICQRESLRNFNEKRDPIHNSIRSINYQGINDKRCLRSVWTFYKENIWKERNVCPRIGKVVIVRMSILLNVIHSAHLIPMESQQYFYGGGCRAGLNTVFPQCTCRDWIIRMNSAHTPSPLQTPRNDTKHIILKTNL